MLDKTVLVTGGGRGIGGSIAIEFAKLGANVVIASRNEAHRKPTEDQKRVLGRKCLSITMSIRVPEEVDALVDATLNEMGSIDVLVNNAGGQFLARPSEISDGGWRLVVDLNLNGTWNMCNRKAAASSIWCTFIPWVEAPHLSSIPALQERA
jgi:NAD(P)-dependent dehydrogenase (short-subunit alcohol dehydrogenase family)